MGPLESSGLAVFVPNRITLARAKLNQIIFRGPWLHIKAVQTTVRWRKDSKDSRRTLCFRSQSILILWELHYAGICSGQVWRCRLLQGYYGLAHFLEGWPHSTAFHLRVHILWTAVVSESISLECFCLENADLLRVIHWWIYYCISSLYRPVNC